MTVAVAGQPLGGRRGHRRGQSQVHLGSDFGDQRGANRRGLRARPAGTSRRSSGHQSGAAGRRSRAASASSLARRRPARPGEAATGQDITGKTVLAAMAQIPGVDWSVIVKQPLAEAFGPIYDALWRTVALLIVGAVLAAAACLLADPAHGRTHTPAGGRGGA